MIDEIHNEDCLEGMKRLPENSVDSIVTDPPYGLSFMGKDWDHGVPGEHFWREALRVAKPGAHLLAFGGTRTYHRLAVAIEDAGWEIRDCLGWLYGSGFPKSMDVGKAIDKAAGAIRDREPCGGLGTANSFADDKRTQENMGQRIVDTPITPDAIRWNGWGTTLKPAWEPIILARKPLKGTIANNVLMHGTGAINIDGCRVPSGDKLGGGHCTRGQQMDDGWHRPWMDDPAMVKANAARSRASVAKSEKLGRFPANIIHDGSSEVLAVFPQTGKSQGGFKAGSTGAFGKGGIYSGAGGEKSDRTMTGFGDSGSAARFFYCAKASKKDRGIGNNHPTVKPSALMEYLVKLITPPNGCVLDPFLGSGSTAIACVNLNRHYIGFELSPEYFDIARARLDAAKEVS